MIDQNFNSLFIWYKFKSYCKIKVLVDYIYKNFNTKFVDPHNIVTYYLKTINIYKYQYLSNIYNLFEV